ncbi:glucose dehydrogenase [FAD, quinone]-like isoform X2 [Microplitis mediator]|uniref:glucose dehydrogenase [FAD, quinone]-like isoform X2 n=1 Tax=Microplitis mediator TaxID=375433 RepID=UPI0025534A09|nr:glucose dehydrogenase [FAD, quinone]-like isoform X2 [Microplitis mediator]
MSYNISIFPTCVEPFLGPTLAQACPGSQFFLFMTLLDTFIRSSPEISQLCNRVLPTNLPDYYYDFVVIGGGSAGAVVAARLSDVPEWKVLLLEAGPDEPPGADIPSMVAMFLGTELDWQYRTTNEKNACLSTNGSCGWPRGRNLGGSSVHNGMMYIRGHARDYDDWEFMGNEGWSWRDVLPHFMNMEDNGNIDMVDDKYHSTGGPLRVEKFPWRPSISDDILRAAEDKGFGLSNDLNDDTITGFTIAQSTSKNGVRVSSASAFLRPVRDRPNLDIALNATVTKILIESRRAIGVLYIQVGPKQHLKEIRVPVVNDLAGVGENLQNHVSYTLAYTISQPNEYDLNWAAALEYVSHQRGPMSSTGMSQITGIISSSYSTPDHPDLQFYFGGFQATCATTGQIGTLIDNNLRSISISPTNLHPRSRGFIRLADNNPVSKPIIQANYFQDPQDVAVLIEGIQLAISLMNSSELAKFNLTLINPSIQACSQFMYLSEEYWSCVVKQDTGPENHQAGSCKMGPVNDPMAVVDSKLKVHGINGLRVADTSIMPKVTSGNTGAPAMMIGERAAAFIKHDWLGLRKHWRSLPTF